MVTTLWLKSFAGRIQETLHFWWKKKIAYTEAQMGDFVKHIFREHNQEADHLANLGADGQWEITTDGVKEHRGLESSSWLFWTVAKKTTATVVL